MLIAFLLPPMSVDANAECCIPSHHQRLVLMLMLSVAGAQVALSQAFDASMTETVSLLLTGGFDHLSLFSIAVFAHFPFHFWIWSKLAHPPP